MRGPAAPAPPLHAPRKSLLDSDLLYLFSYDANLEMRRDEIGFVPGGVRVNVFAKPNETRVYHVARERTVLGSKAIRGTVQNGADWALIRSDNVGVLDVRLALELDDGAFVFMSYPGLFDAGPRGFRRLISEEPHLGTDLHPYFAPVYTTPRFETDDPRYRWLMRHQCAGFGTVGIINSTVRSASFDVYALDA
jgi:hypothetical protein